MAKRDGTSYYDLFIGHLREWAGKEDIGGLFFSLLRILPKDVWEEQLKYLHTLFAGKDDYFTASGKNDWFYIFHKSIRQGDFYQNCFIKSTLKLLTDKEQSELRFLRHEFRVKNKEKKGENGKLFCDEYVRYLDLVNKSKREDYDESINGNLDSILWNAIHLDKKGQLEFIFKLTFDEYDFSNPRKQKPINEPSE